jgi:hypothetical protein
MMRRLLVVLAVAIAVQGRSGAAPGVELPRAADSVKFAVIGDNGTGAPPQYDVGRQLAAARAGFPFEFVMMLGDNMYGSQKTDDFVAKFERPYAALLAAGVPFFSTWAATAITRSPAGRSGSSCSTAT